jgi:tetratricopeptide (TPR) repeat protein
MAETTNPESLEAEETPRLSATDLRLAHARILVEIGELYDAEAEIAELLDAHPEDGPALSLFAKIKHVRGELSEAVACWAQLHARTPQSEAGLLRLVSMFELARDPERGAGEFLAIGNFQLWRKPASHLELEEVFRLFLARRPEEAMASCDRLARKYSGRDAETYKLAVLAKAWVAERTGDPARAAAILEEMGEERGYETDSDRILFLARVYEQLGTPDHLAKAAHVYRYIESTRESLSVLGHLASLYRSLGAQEDAAAYERRFLETFQRRMHRPSFAEVVQVAALRYIPLEKLLTIRFLGSKDLDEPSPRERAIALALAGDTASARAILSGGQEPIDRKYLGDLAVFGGDFDGAISLYIQSLAADPDDLRVVGWLLERHWSDATPEVAAVFTRRDLATRALGALAAARRRAPLRGSIWRQLASLYVLLGQAGEAAHCAERARVLQAAAAQSHQSVGRALAAAVYHFLGRAVGLIHEVWAGRKPVEPGRGGFLDEILGNLTPEMKESVRNTFLSVREYARSRFPARTGDILDYNYTYKVTKEDEPSRGVSAGLPTALAFLSVFLNRAVAQDIAASGVLIADSHDVLVVREVGEAEYKVRGACNRNLRALILPEANRKDLMASPFVPPAVCQAIVRYASKLDQAVTLTFGNEVWE